MLDLFRSDNVVVRSVPASDIRRWVVTFDNYGIGHGFDRPAFGEEFFRKAGVSAVHVMGVREDWYQYPEMGEAMLAVREATAGAQRVMTYGSSMGGYAALRFAEAAGANAVLALSPQYSIDPEKAPFEVRWLQDSQRIRWLPEVDGTLSVTAKPVVIFDPSGDDLLHVKLIEEAIAIERIMLPHCGHPSTTFLGEIGLLGNLVLQVLDGTLDADEMRREARRRRRTSSIHHMLLANLQPQRRIEWGLKLARKSLELAPHNPGAMTALATRLGQMRRHEEALVLYEAATVRSNRDPTYLVAYADGLVASGRAPEAIPIADEAVRKLPASAHLWYWLSVIQWAADDRKGAIGAIEEAIRLHPECSIYKLTLDNYRAKMAPPSRPPLDTAGRTKQLIGRLRNAIRNRWVRSSESDAPR
ncbi:alpha/beta hydrolase [Brevundimonas diminuta]|uniref:Flp pilus assembly protein TadD, contains TPR repeats n=1 Tax=Brevundimonas diminuta TaxID=293 RepID=A0A2X1AGX2_BREDI|nr:alpha/beta hydrolase [Brevundimonas diminuta]SPU44098.1 Flp pilus assembly protein TadD, contains TPR repeats [Brevundimonas diminuta]